MWQYDKRRRGTQKALCVVLAAAMLLSGCSDSAKESDADLGAGFRDLPSAVANQVAVGTAGVSSAHPLASKAGQHMLQRGGNAADAAVATGFALAVVENSMNGLGGRAQIILRTPEGEIHGIDAQTQLGSRYKGPLLTIKWSGIETVGVPGMVAGLLHLHETHGSLPLAEVMAPAISFAKDGFALLPGEASRHRRIEKKIRADETLAKVYLNDEGSLHSPGDIFRQEDLAKTLEKIASGGAESFYRGEIADTMYRDLHERGSGIELADIHNYRARSANLVSTTYRGYEVVSLAGPANGTAVIASLNVLSHMDLSQLSETSWAAVVNQTLALTMQATVFDDSQDKNYLDTIGSERAQAIFEELDLTAISRNRDKPKSISEQGLATTSSQYDWSGASHGKLSHHTTHHVSADTGGMLVSITQTLGPNMGAKVMTPGLGFMYAQTGGMPRWLSEAKAGDRPRTNIAPTLVLRDGQPILALGAAGGPLIPPAIVQVISRVIDRGQSVADAVAAPRVTPRMNLLFFRFETDEAQIEATPLNGWSPEEQAELEAMGIKVKTLERYSLFGRVHALSFDKQTGLWTGVADPDWEGSAAMVEQNTSEE
ncbi:MAG: gamma-glutamyltransferase [Halioglobus sp.]